MEQQEGNDLSISFDCSCVMMLGEPFMIISCWFCLFDVAWKNRPPPQMNWLLVLCVGMPDCMSYCLVEIEKKRWTSLPTNTAVGGNEK